MTLSKGKLTPIIPKFEPESEIELKSEVGIDYSNLKELLSQGKWEEADEETIMVMLKAANREQEKSLDIDSIKKFPCADLRTIDQLWVKYSDGRFGFSVQKKIYLECGAKFDGEYPGEEIWLNFFEQVGWQVEGEFLARDAFYLKAQKGKGHLPIMVYSVFEQFEVYGLVVWFYFFSRAETCNL